MEKQIKHRAYAFDFLTEAVILTDLEGIITDWNKGAQAIYGYAWEEAVGNPIAILFAQDDAVRVLDDIFKSIELAGNWKGELWMLNKSHRSGWAQSLVTPVYEGKKKTGLLWINRDITEQVMIEKRMKALEYFDPLTGIPNRLVMYDRLQQMIATARRHQLSFALYFIDLDNFKMVNDLAGYSVGDAVLREIAQRMQSALRESDTVARAGSDEFVIIAADIRQLRDAQLVADNISKVFDGVIIIGEYEFKMSASLGMAIYPRDGDNSDDLLIKADGSMMLQKKLKFEKTR